MARRWFALMLLLLMGLTLAHAVLGEDEDPELTQEEISLGKAAIKPFEKYGRIVTQGATVDRLRRTLKKLIPATERPELPYQVKLVDSPIVNAITFPGGFIYVYEGLIDLKPDDDMLACVLGHELVHAARSHGYRTMKAMELAGAIGGHFDAVSQIGQLLTVTGVGRRYENEADQFGMRYAMESGYNPRGMLRMMETFQRLGAEHPDLISHMFATHPPVAERIKRIRAELKRMGK